MFHIIRLPISIIFLKYFKLNFIQIKNKTQKYNLTVLLNPQDFVALWGIKAQQLKRSQMQVRKHFFTFFLYLFKHFSLQSKREYANLYMPIRFATPLLLLLLLMLQLFCFVIFSLQRAVRICANPQIYTHKLYTSITEFCCQRMTALHLCI